MPVKDIICWWSGGATSAVSCNLAISLYGLARCRFIFIDTKNESEDTYRFKLDCEDWYQSGIETIGRVGPGKEFARIQEVWEKYNSLNVANGAICSGTLKRDVRIKWEKENTYSHQVFGFDISESKRALSLSLNYPDSRPVFPLLMYAYTKKDCIQMLSDAGIEIPEPYRMGFSNNNCFQTGCVQGGIGYWKKIQRELPEKFQAMAEMEHKLTDRAGKPVTMSKDQSAEAKQTGLFHVFLSPHPSYPEHKHIGQMSGRDPEPLTECNGFCGTYDLEKAFPEQLTLPL